MGLLHRAAYRRRQALALRAEGKTLRQIAEQLGMTPSGVGNMLIRLGQRQRTYVPSQRGIAEACRRLLEQKGINREDSER